MFLKGCSVVGSTDEEKIIIECSCGTHSIHISTFDDEIDSYYLELWSQDFCILQKVSLFKRILHRLKVIWFAIRGKEYRLTDICLNEDDINNIILSLQDIKKSKKDLKIKEVTNRWEYS